MIVFPMAGRSSRFRLEGFVKPKYMLPLWGETVLYWVLLAFARYNKYEPFVFLINSEEAQQLIDDVCRSITVENYATYLVPNPTRGQAETVFTGLDGKIESFDSITIFNIDTILGLDYRLKRASELAKSCVGYMDCFLGDGDHWSFAELGDDNRVVNVKEKIRISPFCSSGLYHFSRYSLFKEAYLAASSKRLRPGNEYFVAPLFNYLIESNYDIRINLIAEDRIFFAGTPVEYNALGQRPYTRNNEKILI